MSMRLRLTALLCITLFGSALVAAPPAPHRKLLVVSVDGLDWRYFQHADEWGLRIPNLRRLVREGWHADGVVGVYPSITWPSHTSLITGVRPIDHGILGNRRPKSEGGDYYWSPDLLHAPTIWQAAHDQGIETASVTWPVTTGAAITYDLPEYFTRRNGGEMDLDSISSKATPGLVEEIRKAYPSFTVQWTDDRARTLATIFLLKEKQPGLILTHLVDLDSDEHDTGPFASHSFAQLELTDQRIGEMLAALPKDYDFVLTSDHGFERIDGDLQLGYLMAQHKVTGDIRAMGGVAVTNDASVAGFLREAAKDPANHLGREIPHDELVRYAPQLGSAVAAFEPAEHYMFAYQAALSGPYVTPPPEKGDHGLWPTHPGYRSVFIAFGPDIKPAAGGEIEMTTIAERLAKLAGIQFVPAAAKSEPQK